MITLDYVERTGLHLRVGLTDDEIATSTQDDVTLTAAAQELAGLAGTPWDINHTSATTVELSFEDER